MCVAHSGSRRLARGSTAMIPSIRTVIRAYADLYAAHSPYDLLTTSVHIARHEVAKPAFRDIVKTADRPSRQPRMDFTSSASTSMMWRMPVISAASWVKAAMSLRPMCAKENLRLPAMSWRSPWARRS